MPQSRGGRVITTALKLCECGCGQPAPIAKETNRSRGYTAGLPMRFVKGHHMRVTGHSEATKQLLAEKATGRAFSQEHREAISRGKKGRPQRLTPQQRLEYAERARNKSGEKHPAWRGTSVSYKTLHDWVNRHKERTGTCSHCGEAGRTDWANISGEYRRELSDFFELCRKCHFRYDNEQGRPRGFGADRRPA